MAFYDFSVPTQDGGEQSMADFAGKVVLVVNTATQCGFTPQYEEIQKMYEDYHEDGLEILDVPCNQFAGQAPEMDEDITKFCQLNYHTAFPQMKKSKVFGEEALPLYKFLTAEKGFEGFGKGIKAIAMRTMAQRMDPDWKESPEIKWNFTKFVIDREGNVIARFEPTAPVSEVAALIEELL